MTDGLSFTERNKLSKDYYAWLEGQRRQYGCQVADHPMTVLSYLDSVGMLQHREHRRRKLITKVRLKWIIFFAVFWGLTPLFFQLADTERGYAGTGGEVLIPLIPVIALILTIAGKMSK